MKALLSMPSFFACKFNKGKYISMVLFLLPWIVKTFDNNIYVHGPERVQEFHVCVGTSAYIPWPLNVISRTGHRATVINLILQRRHSERKILIATFSEQRELKADAHFRERLSISNENSGVFLNNVAIDDTGTFFAQAHISNGQIWTWTTNLTVHMRPVVLNGRLHISQSEKVYHSNKSTDCVNVTCGTLDYPGYPPVQFVWTAESKILATKVATDDTATSVQICSPFSGDLTCSLAGYSSLCIYDTVATLYLDLPAPVINSTIAKKNTSTQDLVLTIVMPILAVLVPLVLLSIWVLSHILKSYPHYREQQHLEHQEPKTEIDIEDNVGTEQTHNNDDDDDDDSDADNTHMEIKEELYDTDEETAHIALEGSSSNYHHRHNDDYVDDPTHRVDNVDRRNENHAGKTNEVQPLMDEVLGTIV